MLKKLFSIVLVLGLTFTVAGPAWADVSPGPEDIKGPTNMLTKFTKGQVISPMDNTELGKVAINGMPLQKPADLCQDYDVRDSQSGFNSLWTFPSQGIGIYALQDMETVCPSPGTLDVTSVTFLAYDYQDAGEITMHAELWTADLTDPGCPVPGTLLATGPEVLVAYPGGDGYTWVELPLSPGVYDYNCIDGLLFVCVRFTSDYTAPYFLFVSSDDLVAEDGLSPVLCKWYREDPGDPGVYEEIGNGLGTDLEARDWYIFGSATTDAQNDCNVPGICGWDWKHCVWETYAYYNFGVPSTSGMRDWIWQQWNAAAPCTILQVDLYDVVVTAGDPGIRVSIYDDNGGVPGNELYYEEWTTAEILAWPGAPWFSFNFPAQQPVIVNGNYYVYVGRASWAGDGDSMQISMDDPEECTGTQLCASGMRANDGVTDISFCDAYGTNYELFAELYTCCAEPKTEEACVEAPDNWFTHGHDYARTCATTMGVGDPCGIALAWKANTTRADKRFSNCAVAGGKVYTSDDQAMHCFDLATGAVQWTYYDATGIQTASAMRNTPTVTGGYVYGSGGTAQSFYKLDTLGTQIWSRHYNSMGGGVSDWLCAAMRFGVSVVIDDKVIFGDDGGCLWALEDATGNNDGSWATNPIDLGGSVYHSPAYPGYGDYIYVATLAGDVFKVNYTDGTYTLIFSEPDAPDDGFYSGCSYDVTEDMIYLASGGDTPMRFKIDTDGVVQWQSGQNAVLYAPPTIGRKKVYFGINDPGGVLIVDKTSGFLEYDFASDGIGSVPQPVTLTCDNYMFAGDRNNTWSLLDVDDFSVTWQRHFQDFVWGTALAYHDLEDKNYAVVSIWSDVATGYARAGLFAWDLDAPVRPMMEVLVTETEIPVPFQTGFIAGGGVADDVFTNWSGCADLNITEPLVAYNIDPATTVNLKSKVTRGDSKAAEEAAEQIAGSDYLSFFDSQGNLTKRGMMSGAEAVDAESFGRFIDKSRFDLSKNQTSSIAAGADLLRTSNVVMTAASPISGGTLVGLTWDYDGTGLERAVDHEYIEIVNDDPDFYPEFPSGMYYPGLDVYYIGGCLFEDFEFMWFNGYEMWHQEVVFNRGRFGDGSGYGLDWGDGINDAPIYDGSFFIFQEGGTWLATWIFDDFALRRLLPNPAPMSGVCGIDYADYVPIGQSVVVDWDQGGGCPPVYGVDYVDLLADVSWVEFIDTLEEQSESYGTITTQVEISPYDFGHGYGDMKFRHFKVTNRNDAVLENVLAGMHHDWDPQPTNNCAMAIVPECGAIAQWDSISPSIAFGHIVMPAYTSAANSGIVDGAEAAYKMLWAVDNEWRVYSSSCAGGECSFDSDPNMIRFIENYSGIGFDPSVTTNGDKGETITFTKFDLPALGEHHLYCAVIGVDATSNDRAAIEDEMRSIAFRANKLAGFARGDVNDDGKVDAIDLAYLDAAVNGSGLPIFPWDGNGDVNNDTLTDAGDVGYLLAYLMGGPAPLGEWRFTFMP